MIENDLKGPRVFEVSYGKTSKIIFIVFSITFSPCVFWSQHESPLLLSPFNRCLNHREGKSVLELARSNVTKRKFLNFGIQFFTGLYLVDLMLWSSSFLLSTLLSCSNCRNTCQTYFLFFPHQVCPALCMWGLEHCRATAETQRQEYYCCLSRKKED